MAFSHNSQDNVLNSIITNLIIKLEKAKKQEKMFLHKTFFPKNFLPKWQQQQYSEGLQHTVIQANFTEIESHIP